MNSKPVITKDNKVSSDVEYIGTRSQVANILKTMRVRQNSIKVNGMIIIKRGQNKFEYGEWMGDFHTGTLEQVVNVIS